MSSSSPRVSKQAWPRVEGTSGGTTGGKPHRHLSRPANPSPSLAKTGFDAVLARKPGSLNQASRTHPVKPEAPGLASAQQHALGVVADPVQMLMTQHDEDSDTWLFLAESRKIESGLLTKAQGQLDEILKVVQKPASHKMIAEALNPAVSAVQPTRPKTPAVPPESAHVQPETSDSQAQALRSHVDDGSAITFHDLPFKGPFLSMQQASSMSHTIFPPALMEALLLAEPVLPTVVGGVQKSNATITVTHGLEDVTEMHQQRITSRAEAPYSAQWPFPLPPKLQTASNSHFPSESSDTVSSGSGRRAPKRHSTMTSNGALIRSLSLALGFEPGSAADPFVTETQASSAAMAQDSGDVSALVAWFERVLTLIPKRSQQARSEMRRRRGIDASSEIDRLRQRITRVIEQISSLTHSVGSKESLNSMRADAEFLSSLLDSSTLFSTEHRDPLEAIWTERACILALSELESRLAIAGSSLPTTIPDALLKHSSRRSFARQGASSLLGMPGTDSSTGLGDPSCILSSLEGQMIPSTQKITSFSGTTVGEFIHYVLHNLQLAISARHRHRSRQLYDVMRLQARLQSAELALVLARDHIRFNQAIQEERALRMLALTSADRERQAASELTHSLIEDVRTARSVEVSKEQIEKMRSEVDAAQKLSHTTYMDQTRAQASELVRLRTALLDLEGKRRSLAKRLLEWRMLASRALRVAVVDSKTITSWQRDQQRAGLAIRAADVKHGNVLDAGVAAARLLEDPATVQEFARLLAMEWSEDDSGGELPGPVYTADGIPLVQDTTRYQSSELTSKLSLPLAHVVTNSMAKDSGQSSHRLLVPPPVSKYGSGYLNQIGAEVSHSVLYRDTAHATRASLYELVHGKRSEAPLEVKPLENDFVGEKSSDSREENTQPQRTLVSSNDITLGAIGRAVRRLQALWRGYRTRKVLRLAGVWIGRRSDQQSLSLANAPTKAKTVAGQSWKRHENSNEPTTPRDLTPRRMPLPSSHATEPEDEAAQLAAAKAKELRLAREQLKAKIVAHANKLRLPLPSLEELTSKAGAASAALGNIKRYAAAREEFVRTLMRRSKRKTTETQSDGPSFSDSWSLTNSKLSAFLGSLGHAPGSADAKRFSAMTRFLSITAPQELEQSRLPLMEAFNVSPYPSWTAPVCVQLVEAILKHHFKDEGLNTIDPAAIASNLADLSIAHLSGKDSNEYALAMAVPASTLALGMTNGDSDKYAATKAASVLDQRAAVLSTKQSHLTGARITSFYALPFVPSTYAHLLSLDRLSARPAIRQHFPDIMTGSRLLGTVASIFQSVLSPLILFPADVNPEHVLSALSEMQPAPSQLLPTVGVPELSKLYTRKEAGQLARAISLLSRFNVPPALPPGVARSPSAPATPPTLADAVFDTLLVQTGSVEAAELALLDLLHSVEISNALATFSNRPTESGSSDTQKRINVTTQARVRLFQRLSSNAFTSPAVLFSTLLASSQGVKEVQCNDPLELELQETKARCQALLEYIHLNKPVRAALSFGGIALKGSQRPGSDGRVQPQSVGSLVSLTLPQRVLQFYAAIRQFLLLHAEGPARDIAFARAEETRRAVGASDDTPRGSYIDPAQHSTFQRINWSDYAPPQWLTLDSVLACVHSLLGGVPSSLEAEMKRAKQASVNAAEDDDWDWDPAAGEAEAAWESSRFDDVVAAIDGNTEITAAISLGSFLPPPPTPLERAVLRRVRRQTMRILAQTQGFALETVVILGSFNLASSEEGDSQKASTASSTELSLESASHGEEESSVTNPTENPSPSQAPQHSSRIDELLGKYAARLAKKQAMSSVPRSKPKSIEDGKEPETVYIELDAAAEVALEAFLALDRFEHFALYVEMLSWLARGLGDTAGADAVLGTLYTRPLSDSGVAKEFDKLLNMNRRSDTASNQIGEELSDALLRDSVVTHLEKELSATSLTLESARALFQSVIPSGCVDESVILSIYRGAALSSVATAGFGNAKPAPLEADADDLSSTSVSLHSFVDAIRSQVYPSAIRLLLPVAPTVATTPPYDSAEPSEKATSSAEQLTMRYRVRTLRYAAVSPDSGLLFAPRLNWSVPVTSAWRKVLTARLLRAKADQRSQSLALSRADAKEPVPELPTYPGTSESELLNDVADGLDLQHEIDEVQSTEELTLLMEVGTASQLRAIVNKLAKQVTERDLEWSSRLDRAIRSLHHSFSLERETLQRKIESLQAQLMRQGEHFRETVEAEKLEHARESVAIFESQQMAFNRLRAQHQEQMQQAQAALADAMQRISDMIPKGEAKAAFDRAVRDYEAKLASIQDEFMEYKEVSTQMLSQRTTELKQLQLQTIRAQMRAEDHAARARILRQHVTTMRNSVTTLSHALALAKTSSALSPRERFEVAPKPPPRASSFR